MSIYGQANRFSQWLSQKASDLKIEIKLLHAKIIKKRTKKKT